MSKVLQTTILFDEPMDYMGLEGCAGVRVTGSGERAVVNPIKKSVTAGGSVLTFYHLDGDGMMIPFEKENISAEEIHASSVIVP